MIEQTTNVEMYINTSCYYGSYSVVDADLCSYTACDACRSLIRFESFGSFGSFAFRFAKMSTTYDISPNSRYVRKYSPSVVL